MELLIIFAIGFASSVFGSFTSGGFSVLGFALLGAYGLSPLLALSTFIVGAFGSQISSLYNFVKADKVLWNKVWLFSILGVFGAYVGTRLVISVDEAILSRLIGFVLLCCLPLTIFKPQLGIRPLETSIFKQYIGHIFYFIISIYMSSLAVGAGIFGFYSQAYFYGMTLLEMKGTAKIPSIAQGIVSVTLLTGAGFVDWKLGGAFFCGAFIGGFIGTHYTIKVGDAWLRKILLVTVFVVSIKLILGL